MPIYGAKEQPEVQVKDFRIDKTPVTKAQFLEFVKNNKDWRRSSVKRIFAEETYLQDWIADLEVSKDTLNFPVINISWFAARAFCKSKGMRLPSLNEWEFVAMASAEKTDAREDPEFIKSILSAYEKSQTYSRAVKLSTPNIYGVYDLHGLVWEWVMDFNSVILSGESRNNSDQGLFCAAGSVGSGDLMNYAAFMRFAFRASLNARYAIKNLGFRCAKDAL